MNPTLTEQIAYMQRDLDTKEGSYPLRIEMKRMTKAEADRNLAHTRAILATLERAQDAPKREDPPSEPPNMRLLQLKDQILTCAKNKQHQCVHCESIANVIDAYDEAS